MVDIDANLKAQEYKMKAPTGTTRIFHFKVTNFKTIQQSQ